MYKEGICTSAYFIEMWRWFTEKMTKWTNEQERKKNGDSWVQMLKDSHVYCREEDENGKPTGKWFRITGFEDHGTSITLIIKKPNGKIEI